MAVEEGAWHHCIPGSLVLSSGQRILGPCSVHMHQCAAVPHALVPTLVHPPPPALLACISFVLLLSEPRETGREAA